VALRGLILGLSEEISNRPCSGDPAKALAHYEDMGISIKGHRDFSPDLNGNGIIERNEWMKTCPGFSVADWLKGGMAPMTEHLL